MKKLIVLLVSCLITSAVYADKPLKFIVSEDVSWDDNIYLTKDGEKSSAISSTQLAAKYNNSIPNSSFRINAGLNVGYNAYTEAPAKNDYMNAGVNFGLNNEFLKFDEKFVYTADPATSELTEREKRINNKVSLGYKTSTNKKISLGVFAADTYDRYTEESNNALNRNRIDVGAKVYYNLSAKTSLYAGYGLGIINYENKSFYNKKNDSLNHSVVAGVEGDITAKINGKAQVSYDYRKYDKVAEGLKDNASLVGYLLSLNYEPSNRNSLTLSGERKMEESTYGRNRYYISTQIGVEYRQRIFTKWTASLYAAYENMGYPESVDNKNRNDDLLNIKPSIEYRFKEYLFGSIWYQFKDKLSNVDSVEYVANKVGVQVKFVF